MIEDLRGTTINTDSRVTILRSDDVDDRTVHIVQMININGRSPRIPHIHIIELARRGRAEIIIWHICMESIYRYLEPENPLKNVRQTGRRDD